MPDARELPAASHPESESHDNDPAAQIVRRIQRGDVPGRGAAAPPPRLSPAEALRVARQSAVDGGIRLVRTPEEMQRQAHRWRVAGESIGFVPTMGALHRGHIELVQRSVTENRHTVVSIFVNPTQFAPGEDFARYPRRLPEDVQMLEGVGVDAVFAPDASDMYAEGAQTRVSVGRLAEVCDGAARPGHFDGVATVVTSLFNCVRPDRAYFGQKDAQQLAVVRRLVRDLHMDIEAIACPTVREPDGLALSSRNEYLSATERVAATCLWRGLFAARTLFEAGERGGARLRRAMEAEIEQEALAELDYAQVVDPETFEPMAEARSGTLCLVAARVGQTRLIDNLILGGD